MKVSEAVKLVVEGDSLLRTGLHHRLLNLSQVSRFILPLVRARFGRPVTQSAVLMALSRLQREIEGEGVTEEKALPIDRLHIQPGLCTLTVAKEPGTHRQMQRLFNRVQEAGGYVTYSEGASEITMILEEVYLRRAAELVGVVTRQLQRRIAGLGVTFRAANTDEPGLLYRLLRQVAMQRINVVEVNSTMTEFTIYVHEKDVRLAFESIFESFVRRR